MQELALRFLNGPCCNMRPGGGGGTKSDRIKVFDILSPRPSALAN